MRSLYTDLFDLYILLQWGKLDKAGCHEILDRFIALGGNFIDTANMYQSIRNHYWRMACKVCPQKYQNSLRLHIYHNKDDFLLFKVFDEQYHH